MGAIKCERHGISGMTEACVHVASAVAAHRKIDPSVRIDGWNNPHVLCPECVTFEDSRERRTSADDDPPPHVGLPDELREVICTECLGAWYPTAGLGALSAAVRRARAESER